MAPVAWGVDVASTVEWIDSELRAAGRPERAAAERAYLKSDLEHYGASVPVVRRVARAAMRDRGATDRDELLAIVAELWQGAVHERRMAAVELLVARVATLEPGDLPLLERLLRESRTWALVDPLAVKVVGPIVEAHEDARDVLDSWAADDDGWLRRAVLLAHLLPMRRGDDGVFERFARFADPMLAEPGFFIRKAIGWVLRERATKRPDEVGAWLLPRLDRASNLTVREASRHLPDTWRSRLLAGRSTARPESTT